MGEIAEMMLDGTMDWETGEWNFDGEDGPGSPMTGAEAAAFRGERRPGPASFKMTKKIRAKVEAIGELRQCSAYHWQVRRDGKVVADWWPHKNKWRANNVNVRGDASAFVAALKRAPSIHQTEA